MEEVAPEVTTEIITEIEKPTPEFDRTTLAGIAFITVGAIIVGVFFVKKRNVSKKRKKN